jgi:hypothetical protein
MEIDKLFSLKELFLAFLSGVIWLVDLCLLLLSKSKVRCIVTSLSQAATDLGLDKLTLRDPIGGFLVILLGVLLPYVIGLSLLPISIVIAEWMYGRRPYTPKEYGAIKEAAVKGAAVNDLPTSVNLDNIKFRFFETYLAHKDSKALGKIAKFAEEAQLYASLLLPLPLFVGLVAYRVGYPWPWSVILGFVLATIFFQRYRVLRGFHLLSLALASLVAQDKESPSVFRVTAVQEEEDVFRVTKVS